jgi:hypothetical protein
MWGGLCDRRNVAEASIVDDRESGAVDRVWSGCGGALGRERQSAMVMEGGKRCWRRRSRNHRNLFPLSGMGNPTSPAPVSEEGFGHNRSKAYCFQARPVTYAHLSVFLHQFVCINSSKMTGNFPEVWNCNRLLSKLNRFICNYTFCV